MSLEHKYHMNFALWLETEEYLNYLLLPQSQISQIGKEKMVYQGTISKYVSREGSYRYVLFVDGKPVSAIQIMSKDKKSGIVANVYTLPEYRHQGLATKLFHAAEKDFQTLTHSRHLSDFSKGWKDSL